MQDHQHDKRCIAAAMIAAVENVRDWDGDDAPELADVNLYEIAIGYLADELMSCRCATPPKVTARYRGRDIEIDSPRIGARQWVRFVDSGEMTWAATRKITRPTCSCGKRVGESDILETYGAISHGPQCCTCEPGRRVHRPTCPATTRIVAAR
jgi:hypothetical protein